MRKAHQGRIAAISDAASGIGQACGVRLAQEGAQIVGVDRENAKQTLDLISAVDGSATAITCDVSEPASVATLKNAVEVNIRRCDILMNTPESILRSGLMRSPSKTGDTFTRSISIQCF
jgi:NAD(P)-dependent dehydrogenase (short-subunit alcohol dehydrogenase family)